MSTANFKNPCKNCERQFYCGDEKCLGNPQITGCSRYIPTRKTTRLCKLRTASAEQIAKMILKKTEQCPWCETETPCVECLIEWLNEET